MTATVLFPSNPLREREVDPAFEREWAALRWADVKLALVDHDALVNAGEVHLRGLGEPGPVLYRGWMVTTAQYRLLNNALVIRGLIPVTDVTDYSRAHHLPGWYDAFASVTPRTVFIPEGDLAGAERNHLITAAATTIGGKRFVVKDYVKSRKHEWEVAAYAGSPSDLPRVIDTFQELQAEFLVGGVAVRQFIDLDKTQPEYRVWWTGRGNNWVLGVHPDHDGGQAMADDGLARWLTEVMQPLVAKFGAPFVVTDIAATAAGGYALIEVGDGQVSGLPENFLTGDGEDAYERLILAAVA